MSTTPAENTLPPRLAGIVEEFRAAEGRDKLDLMIDYSGSLPAASKEQIAASGPREEVHECATPLTVYVENNGGKLRFTFDIPQSAPTVRGFASILGIGLKDTTPEQVLRVPGDLFFQMGFGKTLTPQRLNGSAALLRHMQRLAAQELPKPENE